MSIAPVKNRFFLDLLDTLLPEENGVLAVLHAYFDASHRPSGTFCVAGYAFAKEQAKAFDDDWRKVFGKYGGCHMKELAHRAGRFKGIDKAEADRLIKAAVKIITRRISFGVAISCDLPEILALLPRWLQGFEHAYPVCCHLAMTMLGNHVTESGHEDDIAYFFESGDEYSGAAHRFMMRTDEVPEMKKSYRHRSHSFVGKNDALPLQAADILAWEYAKYRDETVNKRVRNMRMSLASLLSVNREYDSTRYKVSHITGEPLRSFAAKATVLGLLQIEENAAKGKPLSASSPSSAGK
jgi:uncharacterized protein DUF3800